MVGSTALKVVESAPFYREEVQLWSEGGEEEAHSLHGLVPYPDVFNPELPAHFIRKYTRRGQVVLDPFCGSGSTALESILQGRIAYASDMSPLATRMTAAKLSPADITEVTLRLQKINLRRPINLDVYRERFAPFYDIDTFREICNLRASLQENYDRVGRFVEAVAVSLLHGHSAGYLSVYSFPQISLSTDEQESLNLKRRQTPDYRAVVPRILRKTASSLRDGCPSVFKLLEKQNRCATADARNLSYVESASVDLIVTAPPIPGAKDFSRELWLRNWFSQLPPTMTSSTFTVQELDLWVDFMNEVLFESARVVRSGGRCVLDLREIKIKDKTVLLDDEVISLIENHLSRYWDIECALVNTPRYAQLKNCLKERDPGKSPNRLLVLRRR